MTHILIGILIVLAPAAVPALAQAPSSPATSASQTVRLTAPVLAAGKPLAPGTYEFRITAERPDTPAGQPAEAQRWVEIVANGSVVAREIAEVLPITEPHPIGTSSLPRPGQTRVEMLKGGEFLRVSITSADERFLIHLPVEGAARPR